MANKQSGFTLLEISIVLAIIGLILGAALYSSGILVNNTKATATVKIISDLSGAVIDFKARYQYLPGDLPTASQNIQGITGGSACDSGNGNGLIDTAEVSCATKMLVLAGFIKGSATGIMTPFNFAPDVAIMAANNSTVNVNAPAVDKFLPPVQNVIEIGTPPLAIPYDAAVAIDTKLDDGNLATGNIRAYPLPNASGVPPTNVTLDVGL
jgi:prepilin-type N-terminal cleavage/methylation domain-containing protein